MRLKSELWVKAYIRRCFSRDIPAFVMRKGDESAGAIYIKVSDLNGNNWLFEPAPSAQGHTSGQGHNGDERKWVPCFSGEARQDEDISIFLDKQSELDSDFWVIEIEDPHHRHNMDDILMSA